MEQVDLFIFIELEIIVKMLSLRLCQDLFEVPFSFFFLLFLRKGGGGGVGGWLVILLCHGDCPDV